MTVVSSLEAIAAQLRGLEVHEIATLSDGELLRVAEIGGLIDRLSSAVNIAVASQIVERSRPSLGFEGLAARHGTSKPAHLIEQLARVSNAEATHRVRLADAVRTTTELSGWQRPPRFPELAHAIIAGEVDDDAAAVIVRCIDQARVYASADQVSIAERFLVDFATRETVDRVALAARAMRERLDPDGVRPREEEARTRRGIRMGRESHGVVPISGGLDAEFAALLKSEFDSANSLGATPRFVPLDSTPTFAGLHPETELVIGADGDEQLRVADDRSRDQRQHDVLFGIVKAGVRGTGQEPGGLRSTADVTVTIAIADLQNGAGPGYLAGIDEPVSALTVERLLCDSTWRRAVLGSNGETLALGKTQYRFSTAQKRAILIRDGDTCVMCDAPATWGDFHHVIPFNADGARGRTDVSNGVNLCGRDHRLFRNSGWKIRVRDNIPEVLPPPEIDWTGRWRPVGKNRVRANYPSTA